MKKFFLLSLFLSFIILLPNKILAEKNIAGDSASIMKLNFKKGDKEELKKRIIKRKVIEKILEKYQSPLKEKANFFVEVCFKYNIDCYLLPSIAGVESTFGCYVYPNSYNPFGWGAGYVIFSNWEEAIETVALKLKENYIDSGYDTIEKIAPIYAQSSTWSQKVNYFKFLFEKEEEKMELLIIKNALEL